MRVADEKGGVAIKLQAVQRGRQERKQRVKEGEAALGIQAMIRGKQARSEVDTKKNRMIMVDFAPTRPLDVLSIDLLTAASEAATAAGTKQPTFEGLAMKFPTIAEALTQVQQNPPPRSHNSLTRTFCNESPQVKMMFDLEAIATPMGPSLNLAPGITLMQIGAVLSKIGVDVGEDEIASIFNVPGTENIFRAAGRQGGGSDEALSFSVRIHTNRARSWHLLLKLPVLLAVWAQDFLGFLFVGQSSGKLPPVENCDLEGAFGIAVQAFQLFDTSGDGAIVLKEMSKAIKADIETLQERMSEADTDGNGYITFPEFCA